MQFLSWITFTHPNLVQVIAALLQVLATIVAALIALKVAFSQIHKQFEHKIIYEGWKDLQGKLFLFLECASEYDSAIMTLKYILQTQDNNLVNGGNKPKYRQEKWHEFSSSYMRMLNAYTKLLVSFETHEIIFLPLLNMKACFQDEFRKKIIDTHMDFEKSVFPEIYGLSDKYSETELKNIIQKRWRITSEMTAFIDDFRRELQNTTLGKILKEEVPMRKPKKGLKILTRKGFVKIE